MTSVALRQGLRPFYLGGRKQPPVVALSAYFDDCTRFERPAGDQRKGIVAIAGYIGTVDMWDTEFTPQWRAVIQGAPHHIREFKASDCRQAFGEFAPPWTKQERNELTTSLVSVIVDPPPPAAREIIGIGAATLLDFSRADSEGERQAMIEFGYLWCFAMVCGDAIRFAEATMGEGTFQPILDEHDLRGKPEQIFNEMRGMFAAHLGDRIQPPIYWPSHTLEPLQAADLLAYETYKELDNRSESPPRIPSKALERLVEGRLHIGRYYDAYDQREVNDRLRAGDTTVVQKSGLVYDSIHRNGIVRDSPLF